jgi:hypothetical protein
MMNPSPADLCREHWTEPVPPEPDRLVTEVDAAFEQDVFKLAQRQRISNIHHHCEADDLGGTVELTECIFHLLRLKIDFVRLKPFCSDTGHVISLKPVFERFSLPGIGIIRAAASPNGATGFTATLSKAEMVERLSAVLQKSGINRLR